MGEHFHGMEGVRGSSPLSSTNPVRPRVGRGFLFAGKPGGMATGPLTSTDIDGFLRDGYVKLEGALDEDVRREWIAQGYARLGIDPDDRSTWNVDRVHMGGDRHLPVAEIAPRAMAAAEQLLGGADRVVPNWHWGDHFIVNLGERHDEPWRPASPEVPGWHKDGDFFRHFLDSPEQGLLTVVLWTDVVHQGGPTFLANDSVAPIARFLVARPEGVMPNDFDFRARIRECSRFSEATGRAGDVFLIHPYLLHAVSQNVLRVPRAITNPPLALREPMRFDRADGAYSPVERAILNGLGVDRLEFAPTAPRETFVPERVLRQRAMEEEAKARLAVAGV